MDQNPSSEEYEKLSREARVQQAAYILNRAREIRADLALLTDVRAYIYKLRDDAAALLDDLV
jgi:hypothetical protein